MDTKDISGNDLNNPYTEPEAPRMGRRRPHVPSSKPTMSKNQPNKSGGQTSFPAFYFGGLAVRLCWRPNQETVEAAFPSGEAASKGAPRFGQQGFCNFISILGKSLDFRDF